MIGRHMFKEAMDVVEEFGLHSAYDLYAFVIPCMLQDKLVAVVKYMENNKQMQVHGTNFLFLVTLENLEL